MNENDTTGRKRKRGKKQSHGGIDCSPARGERNETHLLDNLLVKVLPLSYALKLLADGGRVSSNLDDQQQSSDKRRVRLVYPYPYTFATFAKARWVGRTILDVYVSEFGSYPQSYYESAIESGRILVSGKTVSCNYSIQGGDELTHTVHRHEPAVSLSNLPSNASYCTIDQPPVDIIYEDESILVVDKPSTMPIHPCGAYHYNSLFEILAHWKPDSYGAKKLYTIYRLDRLTSGVVLLAKNAQLARSLGKCIVERDGCEKIYLARVKGKFPLNLLERNSDESWEFQGCDSADTKEELPAPCVHGELTELTKRYWKGGKQVLLPVGAGFGYWLTDQRGHVTTAASLQDIFRQSLTVTPNDIISLATNRSDGADRSSRLHWLNFACPCRVSSHKDGVCEAGDFSHLTDDDKCKGVKPAQTAFTLLSYDVSTDTSVVIAKPVTGRTHQIRLHLQQLGHPIANDHCYGGDLWCGDTASKDACENARRWLDQLDNTTSHSKAPTQSTLTDTPATNAEIYHVVANKRRECGETLLDFIEKTCVWCARCKGAIALSNNNDGEEESKHQIHQAVMNRTLLEFFVRSHGIWLHALQYRLTSTGGDGPNKSISYRTQLPIWANMK